MILRSLRLLKAVAIIFLLAFTTNTLQATYPPAGMDAFESSVTVDLDIGMGPMKFTAVGPVRVRRDNPRTPPDGRTEIATEIVSMELRGMSGMGEIIIRENGNRTSTGLIKQMTPGVDFPADSFFDLFVEIHTPGGILYSAEPIRLIEVINAIPPIGDQYEPPLVIGAILVDAAGNPVGSIQHVAHYVGQRASFSLAAGGPTSLDPVTIHEIPTVPEILPPALGLTSSDELDGLSYGTAFIDNMADIFFSVDAASAGAASTAVFVESMAGEAHGDEFRVAPPFPAGGGNTQDYDENGSSAPPVPLSICDDIDALAEPPTEYVDPDEDGVPDSPVYFSLALGSPSLGTLGFSAADILVTSGGSSPAVEVSHDQLGLTPADDVDAFCYDPAAGDIVFSLAPGSPSLGGASPADLFRVAGIGPVLPSPPLWAPASVLGLETGDNLNALKCTLPEVTWYPTTCLVFLVLINDGMNPPMEAELPMVGGTLIYSGVDPQGRSGLTHPGGDTIQTEIISMDLTGNAPGLGEVQLQLNQDPILRSTGSIQEFEDPTPGIMDLPPFVRQPATVESFFDVFFQIQTLAGGFFNAGEVRVGGPTERFPPAPQDGFELLIGGPVPLQPTAPTTVQIDLLGGFHKLSIPLITYAGKDQAICDGPVQLMAEPLGRAVDSRGLGPVGTWSVVSGPDTSAAQFSDVNAADATFTPSADGHYVLEWLVTGDPHAPFFSDTVRIRVGVPGFASWLRSFTSRGNGNPCDITGDGTIDIRDYIRNLSF
ncbi:MAG: DUF6073 family protein [Acidobacteriota bacterium]|nr:DUF6073 family protein [Acidobacteriota bacterium]